ncbi:MAG: hypothetical protein V3S44_05085, partial [Alphaproteobacteria bacterium]
VSNEIFATKSHDPRRPASVLRYRDGYINKLRFTNDEVYAYVKRILAESPDPKIIIIHGDHGGGIFMDHNDPEGSCHKERLSPLVAVYSSDGALQRAIPEDVNLVNLYRIVFNNYFATDMALRPNESWFVTFDDPTSRTLIGPEELRKSCPIEAFTGAAIALSGASR